MDIGARIKEMRKGKMTAKELAEKIGVTREHISAVENNMKPISLPTIEKICEIFGYTLQEFFSTDLSPELKTLIDSAKDLTSEQLQHLNNFINSIRVVKKTLPNGKQLKYTQGPGGRELTEEEEVALSEYFNEQYNKKNS